MACLPAGALQSWVGTAVATFLQRGKVCVLAWLQRKGGLQKTLLLPRAGAGAGRQPHLAPARVAGRDDQGAACWREAAECRAQDPQRRGWFVVAFGLPMVCCWSRSSSSFSCHRPALQLETLSLGDNAVCELPASLGNLTRLRQLLVCHNKLRRLPEELGNCSALEELDVHHNALEASASGGGKAAVLACCRFGCGYECGFAWPLCDSAWRWRTAGWPAADMI